MSDTRQRPGRQPADAERKPWRVEGHPGGDPPAGGEQKRSSLMPQGGARRFWWIFLALLALNFVLSLAFSGPASRPSVPYTLFYQQVQKGNVREISSKGDTIQGTFRAVVPYPPGKSAEADHHLHHRAARVRRRRAVAAADRQERDGERACGRPAAPRSGRRSLFGFGPTLLLVGLFVAARAAQLPPAACGLGGLRPLAAPAATSTPRSARRSADVAGIEEAKNELVEIVDFLRNPDRYRRARRHDPAAACCWPGRPGTGKTLLARAVAGEADVPFFSISASEFIEMIVGVGASRVRDLFEQAKEAAPAIIFVDELDAIGRSRGGGRSLRRPRRARADAEPDPHRDGRLHRHRGRDRARARPTAPRCSTRRCCGPGGSTGGCSSARPTRMVARRSSRCTPARCRWPTTSTWRRSPPAPREWSAPTCATSPTRRRSPPRGATTSSVAQSDFSDALEKIVLGTERRIILSPEERERTAYHESGHALLGMLEPGADPVRKVSIIPRGQALGVTFQSPESDRYGYGANYLLRAHRRRARRPCGRGDRVRRRDDGRGVGPRAGHLDRAPDGGALGHVRGGRPDLGDTRARATRARCSRAPTRPPRRRPRASSSTARCAGSSTTAT